MTDDVDSKPTPEDGPIRVTVEPEIWDLVPMFLENREQDLEALRRALRAGDAETVEQLGHRMKGIGGGYGFQYVSTAGTAIEEAAVQDRLEDARAWVEGLADYLSRVEPERGEGEP